MVFSFISLADPQTITGHSKKWDWDPYSMGIGLSEEWLLCANLRQILRLIINQVCLGEQDCIPQMSWGSNKRITVGTLLGLLHPIGRLDLLCRSEAFPCSLVWQAPYSSCDEHSGTECYVFWLDPLWLQRKAPKTNLSTSREAIYFVFLGMHFVNHSGDGKFMYLYGKFMLCY